MVIIIVLVIVFAACLSLARAADDGDDYLDLINKEEEKEE